MRNYIKLTQGQFAIIDNKNYKRLNQWKWYAAWHKNVQSYYAVRTKRKRGKQYTVSMAREILGLVEEDKQQADHINHNTLDNRESNLRIVTNQQNHFNQKDVKGYYWNKVIKKYRAQIHVNGKQIPLGYYATTKEAHSAYLGAKKLLMELRNGLC